MVSEPGAALGSSPGSRGKGIVLASYGRGALVRSGTAILHCGLTGRRLRLVCGDRVHWECGAAADGPSVTAIDPRRNVIERIDSRGRPEPVAANVDRLGMMIAPEPAPDWFLVDRYWAGARNLDIEAVLIANKQDLPPGGLAAELAVFSGLGLTCCLAACRGGQGIEALREQTLTGVTLLVGQSGVGKSSLVNALAPEAAAQTAQLTRDAEGRHTTTTARWYDLGGGGALIDAPGVRDFAPPAHLVRAAERGFVEIHAHSVECRFNDCRHFEEPGCGVRAAVALGRIAARRYESYRRLARLYEDLAR
jgi:ribosome biogenesis GTPase